MKLIHCGGHSLPPADIRNMCGKQLLYPLCQMNCSVGNSCGCWWGKAPPWFTRKSNLYFCAAYSHCFHISDVGFVCLSGFSICDGSFSLRSRQVWFMRLILCVCQLKYRRFVNHISCLASFHACNRVAVYARCHVGAYWLGILCMTAIEPA